MGTAAAGYMIIILAVGTYVGWHARRAHSAHKDIKLYKSRIPTFRKTRLQAGLISIGLAALTLLVIRTLIG